MIDDYHEDLVIKQNQRLRTIMATLPRFVGEFFRGIEPTTAPRTRIAYAYDLRVFFHYLELEHPYFKDKALDTLKVSCLDHITPDDIEVYLEYLNYYTGGEEATKASRHINRERGKARKLASLRTFYKYFYKKRRIEFNPAVLVDLPKIHEKVITRLEVDEVAKLLDEVESGKSLTKQQQAYHEKTKVRDLALLTLLLGTGIRVSECVGLNVKDLDFSVNGMRILRKGGTEVIIYFGEEVEWALLDYLEQRKRVIPVTGHEEALFLSLQNKRLSVRAVQNLVKKYATLVTTLKKISPHKLRSTYGTNLYRETGDIYLVADVLGHKDVNTTKRHYAEIEDARRRMAAKAVKLRDE